MKVISSLLCLAAGAPGVANAFTIEAMKHDIQEIKPNNFDGVIAKFRDAAVSSLWFYKPSNSEDSNFLDVYNNVAKELKGMAKVCAINCEEFSAFCEKNDVKETPTVMMYPINPVPAFKFTGKMEQKAIAGKISKLIADFSTVLTAENVDGFLTTDPTKPKVVLFSKQKKAPTILKALSSETVFKRTVKFGLASEGDTEVLSRFKGVSKFPTIMQIRGTKAETRETYKGDMTFTALKDWVNLHSESGMGDKVAGAGAQSEESIEEAKPWLVQEIPELTQKSQNDICFKGEGLCVIYLADGEASTAEIDLLTKMSKKFTSQLSDRGAKMKWMWMNLKLETEFKALFEPEQLPSAVVFNPHKRLRFAKLEHGEEGEVKGDENGLTKLMDKVLGGDARFKMVPGQKLPAFSAREDPKAGKKSEL